MREISGIYYLFNISVLFIYGDRVSIVFFCVSATMHSESVFGIFLSDSIGFRNSKG